MVSSVVVVMVVVVVVVVAVAVGVVALTEVTALTGIGGRSVIMSARDKMRMVGGISFLMFKSSHCWSS